MELDESQQAVLSSIDGARGLILSVSRRIHERPELGKEEVFASSLLADTLVSEGFNVTRAYADIPTAILGAKGNSEGPRVAFLAEYDALPGIGHGCGHNLITAAALGAGIGLGTVAEAYGGEVRVIGTPAEETDGAKADMCERGCFDGIDAALMVHPYDGNFYETQSLAIDALELEFHGLSAHAAASPWDGRNALDAVLLTFNNINALRQRMRPDARIHGIISDGGKTPNIVPDHASARFYVRAASRAYLNGLVGQFKDCAQAAALATGTRVEIANYEASFDDMVGSGIIARRFRDYMTQALGSGPFERMPDSFGSIDMGNVSRRVPAIHPLVEITSGRRMSLHTGEFRDIAGSGEAGESIIRAAKALALCGLDIMRDKGFLKAVRAEFTSRLGYGPKART